MKKTIFAYLYKDSGEPFKNEDIPFLLDLGENSERLAYPITGAPPDRKKYTPHPYLSYVYFEEGIKEYKTFLKGVDALNFMTSQGWKLCEVLSSSFFLLSLKVVENKDGKYEYAQKKQKAIE